MTAGMVEAFVAYNPDIKSVAIAATAEHRCFDRQIELFEVARFN